MKLKKASIKLTPEQAKTLDPLFNYASKKFHNFSILGQFTGFSDGTMEFEAVALPAEVVVQITKIVEDWKSADKPPKN
jgi:hypothetical protein